MDDTDVTVETLMRELGDKVRDESELAGDDGKIAKARIVRYVGRTPSALYGDRKNLKDFGGDKDKLLKHIRRSDRLADKQKSAKKQKIEYASAPGEGQSELMQMMALMQRERERDRERDHERAKEMLTMVLAQHGKCKND